MNNNNINSTKFSDNDCKSNCKRLSDGFTLFVKFIIIISFILYILNIFFSSISLYLSNIPNETIYNYQIWRLFSSSLITTNIINIIFSILFWVKYASNLESVIGTIKYLLIFIMNSTIIQIFYTILIWIISLIIKNKKLLSSKLNNNGKVQNSGIWPYIACELTLLSLSNPNYPIKFLFFIELKTKYYPIIVFVLFTIVNSLTIDLEILCGIIYAFLYHFVIKKKLKISNNLVRKIENFGCINCFKNFGGFISVKKDKFSTGISSSMSQRVRNVVVNNNNMKGFTPFTGESNIPENSGRAVSGEIQKNSSSERTSNETLDVKINK